MSFEDASKKYARLLLLIFGSIITGFIYVSPAFIGEQEAISIIESRNEWMVIFTMIVIFYFRNENKTDTP